MMLISDVFMEIPFVKSCHIGLSNGEIDHKVIKKARLTLFVNKAMGFKCILLASKPLIIM